MKYIILSVAIVAMLSLTGCRTNTVVSSSVSSTQFETECLGVALDGSQTLRVWGVGKNKANAIEQAKKNAVRDVIFKGINSGNSECNKRPLITEVNAAEKYEYYFNPFFSQDGAYKNYVSSKDENLTSRIVSKGTAQENYGVVVRVNRAELRQRLINDGIIKP